MRQRMLLQKSLMRARKHRVRSLQLVKRLKMSQNIAQSRGLLVFEALIRSLNGEKVDVRQLRDSAVVAMTILSAALPESSRNKYSLDAVTNNLKDDSSINYPL